MHLDMTQAEYNRIRSIIVGLNQSEISDGWNRINNSNSISVYTTEDGEVHVTLDLDAQNSIAFLSVLESYSKPVGNLLKEGISIAHLGKWKRLLTSIGTGLSKVIKAWN